jgi:hypothetical protein
VLVVVVVVVVVVAVLVEVVSCVTTVRRWLLVVTGDVTVVLPEVIVISGVAVVVSCVVERFAATPTEPASCKERYTQHRTRLIRPAPPTPIRMASKTETQYTGHAKLRRVRLTIAAVKNNKYNIF